MNVHIRLLGSNDENEFSNFLEPHTPYVFFMRSNARKEGLVFQGKPYQADYFAAYMHGKMVGILAHSWSGMVQVFALDLECIPKLGRAWKAHLETKPRDISGFLGPDACVDALECAIDISTTDLRGEKTNAENLLTLQLRNLKRPELLDNLDITMRYPTSHDIDFLTTWRHDYFVEALKADPGAQTFAKANAEIIRRVEEGDLFLLQYKNQVVSFCGAGGFLDDWKVVGPVWTPPELRGRGFGKTITAAALLALRDQGAQSSVLFTDNEYAEKAYRSLGFERIGAWRLDNLAIPISRL